MIVCDATVAETGKPCPNEGLWFVRVGTREMDEHHACERHLRQICTAMLGAEGYRPDLYLSVRPIPLELVPYKYFKLDSGPFHFPISRFQADELIEGFQGPNGQLHFTDFSREDHPLHYWGIIRENKTVPWLEIIDTEWAAKALTFIRDEWIAAAKNSHSHVSGAKSFKILASRFEKTRVAFERREKKKLEKALEVT